MPKIPKMESGTSLLKVTLNFSLLFGVMMCFIINEVSGSDFDMLTDDIILYKYITPEHYDIKLELHLEKQQVAGNFPFSGACNISININDPIQIIALHAQDPHIQISNAILMSVNLTVTVGWYKYFYYNETQSFIIKFSDALSTGPYVLKLSFYGFINSPKNFFDASYINEIGDRMWLLATHLQSHGARQIFPCWDDPKVKTTFNITIKHHMNYLALSNTPVRYKEQNQGTDMFCTHFDKTSNMSTHDVAILIFDHRIFDSNSTVWIRGQSKPHIIFLKEVISKYTTYLESRWKSFQKPLEPVRVAIPGYRYVITKKPGLTLYRESSVTYDSKLDNLARKIEVALFVAREMADLLIGRQRLGKVASQSSWFYLWLNEAVITLLEIDVINKVYPDFRISDLFILQVQQESLRLDRFMPSLSVTKSYRPNNFYFYFSYHIKAPVILRMLQQLVTDKVFWNGTEMYLKNPSMSFNDLCANIQAAHDEEQIPHMEKFNITQVMDSWIQLKDLPIVQVTRLTSVLVRIQIENINKLSPNNLWIPVTIATQSKNNFTLLPSWRHHGDWLLKTPGITPYIDYPLEFIEDNWIIVNLQQIGCYRVKYEAENWRKLARCLNSKAYTNIHVINRAQIIDDAFYFLMMDQLDLSIFLDLMQYLSQERDYVAWYPMIKNFEYVSSFLPYPQCAFIKEKFRLLLDNLFINIKKNKATEDQFTDLLRQEAVKWACIFGSSTCKNRARNKLNFEANEKLVPWKKEWVYCKGIAKANYTTWLKIFDTYMETIGNQRLKYLACNENPVVIRNYIQLIAHSNRIQLRLQNKGTMASIIIFHSIISKHANNILVLKYLLDKLEQVKPSQISMVVALTDIINNVYSEEHFEEIIRYVSDNTEQLLSVIQSKIYIRLSEIADQRKHFQNLMEK